MLLFSVLIGIAEASVAENSQPLSQRMTAEWLQLAVHALTTMHACMTLANFLSGDARDKCRDVLLFIGSPGCLRALLVTATAAVNGGSVWAVVLSQAGDILNVLCAQMCHNEAVTATLLDSACIHVLLMMAVVPSQREQALISLACFVVDSAAAERLLAGDCLSPLLALLRQVLPFTLHIAPPTNPLLLFFLL